MTILSLIFAVFVTCVIVWLVNQNKIPAPFHWIAYGLLIIIWFAMLISITGLPYLDQRIG
jgi:hypothetical protein